MTEGGKMAKESWFLILTAIGVALVSLGYGVNPKLGMPLLYGIDIESVNQINMYRAIMGLYLAISLYWIIGALNAVSYTHLTLPTKRLV